MISSTLVSSACNSLAISKEGDPNASAAMELQDAQALIQKSALSEALKQEMIGGSILAHIRAFRDEAALILESSLDSEDKKRCLSATTVYGENFVLRYIRAFRPEAEWLLASTLSSHDKASGLRLVTISSSAEKSNNVILQNLRDFPLTYLFPLFIDTEDSRQRYRRLSNRPDGLQTKYQSHPFRPLLEKLLRYPLSAQKLAQWLSFLKNLPAPTLASWKQLPDQRFIQWIEGYWNKLPVQQQVQWIPRLKDLPALLTWLTQVAPKLSEKSSHHPSRPALNLDVLAHLTYFSFPFVPGEEIMQLLYWKWHEQCLDAVPGSGRHEDGCGSMPVERG